MFRMASQGPGGQGYNKKPDARSPVLMRAGWSFDHETRVWRISPQTATIVFLLPFAGGAFLVLVSLLDRSFVRSLLDEDSLIEWGTSLAILATGVLAAVVGRSLWREGLRAQAVAYGFLALVSVLAAGEDISWGQRVLGLETPESVREINRQDELNVHNLDFVYPVYVAGMLALGLYGSLGSWLVYRRKETGSPNWYLFMPPLFLGGAFLQLAVYRLVRYTGATGHNYGEWCELCVAAAITAFVALNARRLDQIAGDGSTDEESA